MTAPMPTITPRRSLVPTFRITVARLMILIALVAIVLSAWLFYRGNSSIERAWVSIRIAALNDADPVKRVKATDDLRVVDRGDLPRAM